MPLSEFGTGLDRAESLRLSATLWQRAMLESWLLTGSPDEFVAERTGLDAATVRWYEGLFFHCRDRIAMTSYVRGVLTQTWADRPTHENVLRQMAYEYGPQTLELILRNWDGTDSLWRRKAAPANPAETEPSDSLEQITLNILSRLIPFQGKSSVRHAREWQRLAATTATITVTATRLCTGAIWDWADVTETDLIQDNLTPDRPESGTTDVTKVPKRGKRGSRKASVKAAHLTSRNTKGQTISAKRVTSISSVAERSPIPIDAEMAIRTGAEK